jgi:hypothetical protein
MAKKNNNLDGQGFHTHPERINKKGRPPRVIKQILSDLKDRGFQRITESQVRELYEYALTLPLEMLKEILADKDTPLILRVICKALLGNKGYEVLESILSRLNGRPNQRTMIGGLDSEPLSITLNVMKPNLQRLDTNSNTK